MTHGFLINICPHKTHTIYNPTLLARVLTVSQNMKHEYNCKPYER